VAVSGIRVAIGQFNELTDENLQFAAVVWVPEQVMPESAMRGVGAVWETLRCSVWGCRTNAGPPTNNGGNWLSDGAVSIGSAQ
jgi:hypothetical protein